MSRFEINPNTQEPYLQTPVATPEPLRAQPIPAKTDRWKNALQHASQPQTAKPASRATP
jgi:hypothetical protein